VVKLARRNFFLLYLSTNLAIVLICDDSAGFERLHQMAEEEEESSKVKNQKCETAKSTLVGLKSNHMAKVFL